MLRSCQGLGNGNGCRYNRQKMSDGQGRSSMAM